MPLDPIIASGGTGAHLTNAMLAAAEIQRRDRANAILQQRVAAETQNAMLERQAAQDAAGQQQRQQEAYMALGLLYEPVLGGDPGAIEQAAGLIDVISPEAGRALRANPANLEPANFAAGLGRLLKIEPQGTAGLKFGQVNPGDYSPSSLARYAKSGNYEDLQRQYAPPQPVVINTPAYGAGLVSRSTGEPIAQFTTPQDEATARASAEASTARAKAEAQAAGEREGKTAELSAAYRLYETARDGLLTGLSASETGPVVGRMPPVTAAQQTAEGAVAAMAPVLKQLFRVAGEGVFTDRDQQLLTDMIPKRTDRPEARANKIANIDAIVQAKLKQQAPQRRVYDPETGTIR